VAEAKKAAGTPRMSGRALEVAARVVKSGAGGPIRRWLGTTIVDKRLADLDLQGAGEPAPFYMPPRWPRDAGEGGAR
jgi:hypothetical protein